jgi:hypothetical protein
MNLKPGETNTRKLLAAMASAVAKGIEISFFFRGAGEHHKLARSRRSSDQVIGEVRRFYAARPRPWRYYGNNAKRHHLQKGGRTWGA